jgi:hypothetical protein
MKLLLIITVLGVGGPRSHQPSRLGNATVAVRRVAPSRAVAASANGKLEVRLGPGLYTLVAMLNDEPGARPAFCEATAVAVPRTRGRATRHISMYCSIK